MRNIVLYGAVILMAAGCVKGDESSKITPEQRAKDVEECIAYGYDEGTPLFTECMKSLEDARAKAEMQRIHRKIEEMQDLRQRTRDRNF